MTTTNQINKLRSAALITANKWDGLMMPAERRKLRVADFRPVTLEFSDQYVKLDQNLVKYWSRKTPINERRGAAKEN